MNRNNFVGPPRPTTMGPPRPTFVGPPRPAMSVPPRPSMVGPSRQMFSGPPAPIQYSAPSAPAPVVALAPVIAPAPVGAPAPAASSSAPTPVANRASESLSSNLPNHSGLHQPMATKNDEVEWARKAIKSAAIEAAKTVATDAAISTAAISGGALGAQAAGLLSVAGAAASACGVVAVGEKFNESHMSYDDDFDNRMRNPMNPPEVKDKLWSQAIQQSHNNKDETGKSLKERLADTIHDNPEEFGRRIGNKMVPKK